MNNEFKPPILITGAHRSGTSIMTHALTRIGLSIGEPNDIIGSSPENPNGYFENNNIVKLHNNMLESMGHTWKSPPKYIIHPNIIPDGESFRKKAQEITSSFANEFWGFKDPRACIFIPFWQDIFPEIKIVVCVRNPLEVGYSLNKRLTEYGLDYQAALNLWDQYYSYLFELPTLDNIIFTHIDSCLYDAESELSRVMNFIGKEANNQEIGTAASQINEKNIKSGVPSDFLADDPYIKISTNKLYKKLEALVGENYQKFKKDKDFLVHLNFSKIKQVYYQNIDNNKTARYYLLSDKANLDKLKDQQELLREKIELKNQEIENLNSTLQNKINDFEKLNSEIQTKENIISNGKTSLENLKHENAQLIEEINYLSQSEAQLREQFEGIINSRSWKLLNRIHIFVLNTFPFLLPNRKKTEVVEPLQNQPKPKTSNVSTIPANKSNTASKIPFIYPSSRDSQKKKIILYVYDESNGLKNSRRYRVENIKEYLDGNQNIIVKSITFQEVNSLASYERLDFDAVVFFRVPHTKQIEDFIAYAKENGKIIVYDIDDFVFDLSISKYVEPLKRFSHDELIQYYWGVQQYRKLIELCDYSIAPTNFLVEKLEEVGTKAYLIPNGLNKSLEDTAKQLRNNIERKKQKENRLKIGYLSGTNTHDRDFQLASPALLRILDEYPNVTLSIRGPLNLPHEFERFENQVEKLPLVPYEELLEATMDLDVLLAPLEKNPYTEAKSELKYFEPALLKIPVIASDTQVFIDAITNGENGFIAKNDEEWYTYLKTLIDDNDLRASIGAKAHEHALDIYGSAAQANTTINVFQSIFSERGDSFFANAFNNKKMTVNWVVPVPSAGSGGHRVIFELSQHLAEQGHKVSLYFMNNGNFSDSNQLKKFLDSSFFNIKANIVLGTESISHCDALFATAWSTVGTVQKNKDKARELFYFVQDLESLFYPMGVEHIIAYSTYELGMNHITIGSWLTKMIQEKFNGKSKYFPFPIDHTTYAPSTEIVKHNPARVVFFARKHMARRCYPLGVETLRILKETHPEIEIVLYGTNQVQAEDFPYPHKNLGVISVKELADLYRSCDVGLTFTTTNPSIVPYEMMACGLPVVDLDFNDNDIHYGGRENISLAFPAPNIIADEISNLLADEQKRQMQIKNGVEFVKNLPSRKEAAEIFEGLIKEYFDELGY